ncbi:hypothetical protein LCGC14_3125850, partial [marine sediment metagenome]
NKVWTGKKNPRWKNKVQVHCSHCGKEKYVHPCEAIYKNYFCDKECKGKWQTANWQGKDAPQWNPDKIVVECNYCGKPKTIWPAQIKRKQHFCDVHCMGKWNSENITGELCSSWKGGITDEREKERKTPEYKEWRFMVYGRDNYTCQMCSERGVYLHAHHIRKFAEYPMLRLAVFNGITLCRKCHGEIFGHEEEYVDRFDALVKEKEAIA